MTSVITHLRISSSRWVGLELYLRILYHDVLHQHIYSRFIFWKYYLKFCEQAVCMWTLRWKELQRTTEYLWGYWNNASVVYNIDWWCYHTTSMLSELHRRDVLGGDYQAEFFGSLIFPILHHVITSRKITWSQDVSSVVCVVVYRPIK